MVQADLKKIGQRIRKRRELLGYTRETLAEKLDITPKFCSDIELGVKGMSINTLCNISDVLKLTTDYILFGKEDDNKVESIINMLNSCNTEKLKYLEDIVKSFVLAVE